MLRRLPLYVEALTGKAHTPPQRTHCPVFPCPAADSKAAAEASPYVEALTGKGYEVLYLTEPIDEVAVQNLEVGAAVGGWVGAGWDVGAVRCCSYCSC